MELILRLLVRSLNQYSNVIRYFVFIHKEQNYRCYLAYIQLYYFWLFCLFSGSKLDICMRQK